MGRDAVEEIGRAGLVRAEHENLRKAQPPSLKRQAAVSRHLPLEEGFPRASREHSCLQRQSAVRRPGKGRYGIASRTAVDGEQEREVREHRSTVFNVEVLALERCATCRCCFLGVGES